MREPDRHDFYSTALPIEVGLCLLTGAHQVAYGLMMFVRHPHSCTLAGAQQPRQGNCITTIVLDPVTRLLRHFRRRDDSAGCGQLRHLSIQPIAAATSFIAEVQFNPRSGEPVEQATYRIRYHSLETSRAYALLVDHRDCNCFLVNIKANGFYLGHDSPPESKLRRNKLCNLLPASGETAGIGSIALLV